MYIGSFLAPFCRLPIVLVTPRRRIRDLARPFSLRLAEGCGMGLWTYAMPWPSVRFTWLKHLKDDCNITAALLILV